MSNSPELIHNIRHVTICAFFYREISINWHHWYWPSVIKNAIKQIKKICVVCTLIWRLYIEIDRYIRLPIFFPIFKHFTIIGYRFWKNLYIYIFFFVTYIIIQSITSSEMCSLYLTHPSTHTLGSVDTHTHTHTPYTHTWSSGHCSLRRSSSTTTACNFIQDSLVWNTIHYINIYYRTIISPINI